MYTIVCYIDVTLLSLTKIKQLTIGCDGHNSNVAHVIDLQKTADAASRYSSTFFQKGEQRREYRNKSKFVRKTR